MAKDRKCTAPQLSPMFQSTSTIPIAGVPSCPSHFTCPFAVCCYKHPGVYVDGVAAHTHPLYHSPCTMHPDSNFCAVQFASRFGSICG